MGSYFLDTSALVKRYFAETGHAWVQSLCRTQARNTVVLAETTLTECVASLCRMVRENPPRLSESQRNRLIVQFQRHVRQNYLIVEMDRTIFWRAGDLCRNYPLRAFDALQLASALSRRDDDRASGRPDIVFVCADTILLNAAIAERFAVENPNNHP